MVVGFGFVVYGIRLWAFESCGVEHVLPGRRVRCPVEFIGVTFLVVYRSTRPSDSLMSVLDASTPWAWRCRSSMDSGCGSS